MAWEVIFGSDPRFLELMSDDIEQQKLINEKILAINNDPSLDWFEKSTAIDSICPRYPFGFIDSEHPEKHILFRDPANKQVAIHSYYDSVVVPISSLVVFDYDSVLNLLGNRYGGGDLAELRRRLAKPEANYELELSWDASLVDYPGLKSLVCTLQVLSSIKKPGGKRDIRSFWHSQYSIYFDRPIGECYWWFMRFEEAAQTFSPNIVFGNRVGMCNDCQDPLELEEHGMGRAGQGVFLCDSCLRKRETERLARKEKQRREAAQRRLEKKLKVVKVFIPEQIIAIPNGSLSRALYEAYGGKCQYCFMPQMLSRDQLIVEHIVPRSLPLERVPEKLLELGITSDQVKNFCSTFLPPHHAASLT